MLQKAKFGGMTVPETQWLKVLESADGKYKHKFVEALLNSAVLKDVIGSLGLALWSSTLWLGT